MSVKTAAQGEEKFDITVNARKVFEIVRELPDGMVKLAIDENVLLIESEKGFSCKLAGADSRDFPGFPDNNGGSEFEIAGLKIKDLIIKSSFAVASDESRACLCGIFWEVNDKKTGMVATDGHRLGSCFINEKISVAGKVSGIVSPKSMLNLIRVMESKTSDEMIKVTLGEKYVTFTTKTVVMCSKLIEGPYPDYTKVIPRNNPKQAIIERAALLDAVQEFPCYRIKKHILSNFRFGPEFWK